MLHTHTPAKEYEKAILAVMNYYRVKNFFLVLLTYKKKKDRKKRWRKITFFPDSFRLVVSKTNCYVSSVW